MSVVGINIGALTVKAVALGGGERTAAVAAHRGRPLETLERLLAAPEFAGAEHFGVCGALGHITEVAAIQRALEEAGGGYDAVASLGGESFLVYTIEDGRIANVLSHNKCAAGSGEFLVQQIGRMGLGLEEAIRRSFAGKVVPLASRCSVHCKSDITHKLNRHEASPEDVLRTLHDSMAAKVVALLDKAQREPWRVLLIGGVAQNSAMVAALRQKKPGTEIVVRPDSAWFDAWGCALLTRRIRCTGSPGRRRRARWTGSRPWAPLPGRFASWRNRPRCQPKSPRNWGPWFSESTRARRRPRRFFWILRPGDWSPRITPAQTGTRSRPSEGASGNWPWKPATGRWGWPHRPVPRGS